MATTAELRNGLCIVMNSDIWTVTEFQHVKPGKGPAFVRMKIKSLTTGRVVDNTMPSGHEIITARILRRPYQFLYKDDTGYNFMDNETFEQISIQENLVGGKEFLREGDTVEVMIHEETNRILSCELPSQVVLEVTYVEPAVKGNTATNATKPATLETGAIVHVPLFVDAGEKVKVDTRTGEYVERVRN